MKPDMDLIARYCENPLTKEQRNHFICTRTWDWQNPLTLVGLFLIALSCLTNGIMLLAFTSWTIFLFVAASTLVCWLGAGALWLMSRWNADERSLGMPNGMSYHQGDMPALRGSSSLANVLITEINRQGRPIMVFEKKLVDIIIREKA